jgi:hypothetical protein
MSHNPIGFTACYRDTFFLPLDCRFDCSANSTNLHIPILQKHLTAVPEQFTDVCESLKRSHIIL